MGVGKWKKKIRFWEDKCVGNISLKVKFPRLYSTSSYKDKVVNELGIR